MIIFGTSKRRQKIFFVCCIMLLVTGLALFFTLRHDALTSVEPVLLILDTDISSDVDDVGAVALLHGLANQGRVRILAMMISSGDPWSGPCLDAINAWFGRPDIPIGVIKGEGVRDKSKYTKKIANEFSHKSRVEAEPLEAVQLYRRTLSAQRDHSVTLVTIGYLTNLHNLLLSKADSISPLDGLSLVRRKIKTLVCMGGRYPAGREWNFYQDALSAEYVIRHWPTPVIFSGFEIGKDILTGSGLRRITTRNPVRRSYELYNNLHDRPSWDQITIFYAVTHANGQDVDWWSRVYGQNVVEPDGRNYWIEEPTEQVDHSFLILRSSAGEIADRLEQLMSATAQ